MDGIEHNIQIGIERVTLNTLNTCHYLLQPLGDGT